MADGTAQGDCAVIRAGRLLAFLDTINQWRWPSTIVVDARGISISDRRTRRFVPWSVVEYLYAPRTKSGSGCVEIGTSDGAVASSAIAWTASGAVRRLRPHMIRFAQGRSISTTPPEYWRRLSPPSRAGDPTPQSSLRAIHVAPLGWHRVRIVASGDGFLARLEAADGTSQVDKPLRHTRAEAIADGDQLIEEFGRTD